MSEENSPSFAQGLADGMADNERARNGEAPIGPMPPNPAYPVMYLKGYRRARGG